MAAGSEFTLPRSARLFALAAGIAVLGWLFPLFHIVPLAPPNPPGASNPAGAFDARAAAEKLWRTDFPGAASRATELNGLVAALRINPDTAKTQFAKSPGVGVAYYFVRGSGKVVSRERNSLRIAVDGAAHEIVALRIGPVFGNNVRDGCGLVDVNGFPGVQEFNALAAELNSLVENQVLPRLREKGNVGTTIHFAGCAEAPEAAAEAGEPLLTIVPVQAEIR